MEADEYQREASRTSRINWENKHGPDIAVLGMIGELGSLASVIKKQQRDKEAFVNYESNFIEELGDILWYVTSVATRLNIEFEKWPTTGKRFTDAFQGMYSLFNRITLLEKEKTSLHYLADEHKIHLSSLINSLLIDMQGMAQFIGANLSIIAKENCDKILSYWSVHTGMQARQFDRDYPEYEQLPRQFEIDFRCIGDGKTLLMQMNGMNLGDRLTDNSYGDDGYRFHDVFHLAGVVTLGWSPVFRRMLKLKRKSVPKTDEVEDGARAAIIEEALINHVYDYARPNFLEGMKRIDLDLIKRIQDLVRGYEVYDCEPWEWQDCILKGYYTFRLLKKNGGGKLILNADDRSIKFEKHL